MMLYKSWTKNATSGSAAGGGGVAAWRKQHKSLRPCWNPRSKNRVASSNDISSFPQVVFWQSYLGQCIKSANYMLAKLNWLTPMSNCFHVLHMLGCIVFTCTKCGMKWQSTAKNIAKQLITPCMCSFWTCSPKSPLLLFHFWHICTFPANMAWPAERPGVLWPPNFAQESQPIYPSILYARRVFSVFTLSILSSAASAAVSAGVSAFTYHKQHSTINHGSILNPNEA